MSIKKLLPHKERILKTLGLGLTLILLSSCSTVEFKPEPCFIYSEEMAVCTPQDDPSYDRPVSELIGYTAFSPEDTENAKIIIEKALDELSKQLEKIHQLVKGLENEDR